MNERNIEIINRFANSWIETENRYKELIDEFEGFEKLIPLRNFIQRLKENGEDKNFRLGTSMHILLISRSVNHGLRDDQKYIKIYVIDFNDFEIVFRDGNKLYREYRIKSLDDIKLINLLKILKHTLID